mmetsp:Transcript_29852/g.62903  ORF Transcript_29852/g.62903 Transcript_29852/m.62903 type:complete len:256 (-) Transcript_29852:1839-2606(-)
MLRTIVRLPTVRFSKGGTVAVGNVFGVDPVVCDTTRLFRSLLHANGIRRTNILHPRHRNGTLRLRPRRRPRRLHILPLHVRRRRVVLPLRIRPAGRLRPLHRLRLGPAGITDRRSIPRGHGLSLCRIPSPVVTGAETHVLRPQGHAGVRLVAQRSAAGDVPVGGDRVGGVGVQRPGQRVEHRGAGRGGRADGVRAAVRGLSRLPEGAGVGGNVLLRGEERREGGDHLPGGVRLGVYQGVRYVSERVHSLGRTGVD